MQDCIRTLAGAFIFEISYSPTHDGEPVPSTTTSKSTGTLVGMGCGTKPTRRDTVVSTFTGRSASSSDEPLDFDSYLSPFVLCVTRPVIRGHPAPNIASHGLVRARTIAPDGPAGNDRVPAGIAKSSNLLHVLAKPIHLILTLEINRITVNFPLTLFAYQTLHFRTYLTGNM